LFPSLAQYAMAAILLLIPKHGPESRTLNDIKRMSGIARSMSGATNDAVDNDGIMWIGPSAQELNVLALAVTVHRESKFDKRIQYCYVRGDHGKSITLYQMMRPWALQRKEGNHWVTRFTTGELCGDVRLASGQALYLMREAQGGNPIPMRLFQQYTTGSPNKRVPRVVQRCMIWQRLAKRMGLRDMRDGKIVDISCWRRPENVIIDPNINVDLIVAHQFDLHPEYKNEFGGVSSD